MHRCKRSLFRNLCSDLRNASSHSLDDPLSGRVEDCLSAAGIAVRRPLVRGSKKGEKRKGNNLWV